MMRAAITAMTLMLILAAPASAAETPDEILSDLAGRVSHGVADVHMTMPQLEAKLASGARITVPCGTISLLGQRAMTRAGIPSRRVGTFSSQRYEMYDIPDTMLESHAMLEVWQDERWVLYDLDSNVQPVTETGGPVTISEFADMPVRHYRQIASDQGYDPTGDPYPLYAAWWVDHVEEWYDRVLDIVTIQDGGHYVYSAAPGSLLAGYSSYWNVSADEFARVAAAGPPPKPVVPRPVAPAPATPVPPTAASPPVTTPRVVRPGCRLGGRLVRHRRVSCAKARKVLRRYGRGQRTRGWRCEGVVSPNCSRGRAVARLR